ncbi:MAG: tripartite tricarboxylate transporter substrate binding protein [Betaproteobacteria bacterium]|nr:tripartite tricarboxylate transporter substrate binding protein [Betaproteobacteria bacterium]
MTTVSKVAVFALCLGCAGSAFAQAPAGTYPSRPVRFVVPWPPGGSNDVLSRVVAQSLSGTLGQQVVIDNRGGAGGMIGAENAVRSAPDGYTLLNVQASFATNTAVRARMPYDPMSDFAYIGMMAKGPMLVVVHPSMPVKSVRELVQLARARPGQINYGSTGTGGSNHLATELFRKMAGINIVHVPYKGVALALTDLMGGHTQLVITSLPSALTQVKAGRLKALAVASSRETPFMPGVPTVSQSGVPGYVVDLWWGIAAPAKTPADILVRLSSDLRKVLQTPEVKKSFAREGAEPLIMSREEFTEFVRQEIARWRKVAGDSNIKLD